LIIKINVDTRDRRVNIRKLVLLNIFFFIYALKKKTPICHPKIVRINNTEKNKASEIKPKGVWSTPIFEYRPLVSQHYWELLVDIADFRPYALCGKNLRLKRHTMNSNGMVSSIGNPIDSI
jgi:hypothetical protein